MSIGLKFGTSTSIFTEIYKIIIESEDNFIKYLQLTTNQCIYK